MWSLALSPCSTVKYHFFGGIVVAIVFLVVVVITLIAFVAIVAFQGTYPVFCDR